MSSPRLCPRPLPAGPTRLFRAAERRAEREGSSPYLGLAAGPAPAQRLGPTPAPGGGRAGAGLLVSARVGYRLHHRYITSIQGANRAPAALQPCHLRPGPPVRHTSGTVRWERAGARSTFKTQSPSLSRLLRPFPSPACTRGHTAHQGSPFARTVLLWDLHQSPSVRGIVTKRSSHAWAESRPLRTVGKGPPGPDYPAPGFPVTVPGTVFKRGPLGLCAPGHVGSDSESVPSSGRENFPGEATISLKALFLGRVLASLQETPPSPSFLVLTDSSAKPGTWTCTPGKDCIGNWLLVPALPPVSEVSSGRSLWPFIL
ncbi:uncharacterized protein LOC115838251 [Nomascus leucogenys]|uniref:uncharacterized protein LOC115838251 n=1 Tax=Nomascus leucogenys TaxID=61853 RepID=UPI00122D8A34|nr:uncharacterized protein LOC115838251 [Nomascus leucogenys]